VAKQSRQYQFDLSGGHLALDFANTISWRGHPTDREDHLLSPADLVSFAVQDKILTQNQASRVKAEARDVNSFRKALSVREAIYRVFAALAQGKTPSAADVGAINDCAIEALRHRQLLRSNGGYRWEWQSNASRPLDQILWPIVIAAADLLTSKDVKLVRWCEAPECQWLFLDNSRNRSRRWCDMKVCGNRAKARRHYQRIRE
jgi:predicted RNA-binding Zn ribbon-like protein